MRGILIEESVRAKGTFQGTKIPGTKCPPFKTYVRINEVPL